MDRNNMRSNYVNSSGPRSLPHMSGNKRHNGNGNGNGNGHRLSPPMQSMPVSHNHTNHNNNNHSNHHDDLINYIKDSWNKVIREDAKYYEEVMTPRQLANFRPFDLDELWGRRLLQSINRNKHRS